MSTEKCFCHLNGYQVKDATARKQMPLIAQAIIEFQNFTYNDLYTKFQTKEELSEGLNKDWFNKPTIAGERFFAVATTSDKITVGFTAEVIRVGSTGTVHFKLIDLVTLYRAPLMFFYTLEPSTTAETLLKGGYKNSAPVSGFNRRPLAGELFYTTLKTPQGDVLTMTARLTGEYATNDNGEEFAVFESVEIIQIHAGGSSGGSSGGNCYAEYVLITEQDATNPYRVPDDVQYIKILTSSTSGITYTGTYDPTNKCFAGGSLGKIIGRGGKHVGNPLSLEFTEEGYLLPISTGPSAYIFIVEIIKFDTRGLI